MKKHFKFPFKQFLFVFLGAVLLLGMFLVWFYKTPFSEAKEKIGTAFSLPVLSVEGNLVSLHALTQRAKVLEEFQNGTKLSTMGRYSAVSESLIADKKIEVVAKKYSITVDNQELAETLTAIQSSENSAEAGKFEKFLQKYSLNERSFGELVLKPRILEKNLIVWYNSQRKENAAAYEQADLLLSRIASGEDFGSLAKQYSQDDLSFKLDGDLGFVDTSKILYELRQEIASAQPGQPKLVPSRLGLHILLVSELSQDGEQPVHVRQIFLKTKNFEQWYQNETKNISVKKFVTF